MTIRDVACSCHGRRELVAVQARQSRAVEVLAELIGEGSIVVTEREGDQVRATLLPQR